MKLTNDEVEAASKRAHARLQKTPCAVTVRYDPKRERVVIDLSTGLEIAFRPNDAQGLTCQSKPARHH